MSGGSVCFRDLAPTLDQVGPGFFAGQASDGPCGPVPLISSIGHVSPIALWGSLLVLRPTASDAMKARMKSLDEERLTL